jgi:hypothetical protein
MNNAVFWAIRTRACTSQETHYVSATERSRLRTVVSEELSASIIRVTRIGELGMLAVTSNRCTLRRNAKWERKLVWNPDGGCREDWR